MCNVDCDFFFLQRTEKKNVCGESYLSSLNTHFCLIGIYKEFPFELCLRATGHMLGKYSQKIHVDEKKAAAEVILQTTRKH